MLNSFFVASIANKRKIIRLEQQFNVLQRSDNDPCYGLTYQLRLLEAFNSTTMAFVGSSSNLQWLGDHHQRIISVPGSGDYDVIVIVSLW